MPLLILLPIAGAAASAAVAGATLLLGRRSLADWALVAGLTALAAERIFSGMSLSVDSLETVRYWQQWRLSAFSAFPGAWLLFSLTYARGNALAFVTRWRLTLVAAILLPIVFATALRQDLIASVFWDEPTIGWRLRLGWSGIGLYFCSVLASVLVLMNLERTFRASVGTMRWRIKFILLGIGVLFVVQLYASSQALLFRGFTTVLENVISAGTVAALLVIARGVWRASRAETDVYPSLSVLQGSLTVTLAGIYLLIVGVFAKVAAHFGGDAFFAFKAFVVLVSLVGLAVLLQSDRIRLQLKRFVSRNFQRPIYDYRGIWRKFSDGTAACVDQTDLCRSIVSITAEIFQSLAVSLWLADEGKGTFTLAGSTSVSGSQARECTPSVAEAQAVREYFETHPEAVDIEQPETDWAAALRRWHPSDFPNGGNRLCVPLLRPGRLVGVLMLGDRVSGVAFPLQDFDLLKCIADQAAASLLNVQLSQRLLQAKELEAFQNMAAFFVHDLKNAASSLNLMLRNLPIHFADPQFREDALRGVGNSVAHINQLISRLGQLRHELTLQRTDADLNQVVQSALAGFDAAAQATVIKDLGELPPVRMDQEQIQKVATNLVLNAMEAVTDKGVIRVATTRRNGWVVLSVADNGCGMSPEFLQRSLFRPFQTTKKRGLGIGLFQSRMIVEAHGGTISVASEPGRGTTFEVNLPTRGN